MMSSSKMSYSASWPTFWSRSIGVEEGRHSSFSGIELGTYWSSLLGKHKVCHLECLHVHSVIHSFISLLRRQTLLNGTTYQTLCWVKDSLPLRAWWLSTSTLTYGRWWNRSRTRKGGSWSQVSHVWGPWICHKWRNVVQKCNSMFHQFKMPSSGR